jgi:hypothetical protein
MALVGAGWRGWTSRAKAAVRGTGDWSEDLVLAQKYPHAGVVIGGNLFGCERTASDYSVGLTYFDGNVTRSGVLPAGNMTPGVSMWTDGTNLFFAGSRTVKTLAGSGSGTFIQGETCTQAVSGATGLYIRTDPTDGLVLQYLSGTFDNSHTITGGTSGATWTPTALASATKYVLQRSTSPTDNSTTAVPVLDVWTKILPGMFVDCGTIGTDHVLLFFSCESTDTTHQPELWYSTNGTSWTKLFTCLQGSIDHWHGGQMVRNLNGGSTHMLLVYTGDTDQKSSILICEDVADLIANPSTWKTRWALDVVAANRNPAAGYYLGINHQRYRVIRMAVDPAKRYAYWIPDDTENATSYAQKADLVGKTVTNLNSVKGMGNLAVTLSNGAMLLASFNDWSGTAYRGSSDKYLRLYAVSEDGDSVYQVWARERGDSASPVATGSVWFYNMLEFPAGDTSVKQPAVVWLEGAGSPALPRDGTVVGHYYPRGLGHQTWTPQGTYFSGHAYTGSQPLVNLVRNGRFTDLETPLQPQLVTSHCAIAQETTMVDAAGGNTRSLKATPDGAGLAYVDYRFPDDLVEAMRGQWITARVRCLWTAGANQVPNIQVYDGVQQSGDPTRPWAGSAAWYTLENETWIDHAATCVYIRMVVDAGGSAANPVYLSDLSVTIGANKGRVPPNPPSLAPTYIAAPANTAGPPTPYHAGMLWLDTDAGANGTLKCYSNGAWRTVVAF